MRISARVKEPICSSGPLTARLSAYRKVCTDICKITRDFHFQLRRPSAAYILPTPIATVGRSASPHASTGRTEACFDSSEAAKARNCVRVDGAVGQNRPCLITWGWKEANLQSLGEVFLLTFPLIEPTGYLPPEDLEPVCTRMNIDENDGPRIQKLRSKRKSGFTITGTAKTSCIWTAASKSKLPTMGPDSVAGREDQRSSGCSGPGSQPCACR